jgi:hypothetical protein
MAMMQVVLPLPLVVLLKHVELDALAALNIVLPVSIVRIPTICKNQAALARSHVPREVTLIDGTICPSLLAVTLADVCAVEPLAVILAAIFEIHHGNVLYISKGHFEDSIALKFSIHIL